jgi:hypothetical protein
VHLLDAAFRQGVPGLCRLARSQGADALVLRRDGGLLGVHDARPSARWRVDPEQRTASTIDRQVGDGLTYRDLNATEALGLSSGATLGLGWSSPSARLVEVDLLSGQGGSVELRLPDGRVLRPQGSGDAERFVVDGIPPGTRLRSVGSTLVSRVAGYERVPGVVVPSGSGATVLTPHDLCHG